MSNHLFGDQDRQDLYDLHSKKTMQLEKLKKEIDILAMAYRKLYEKDEE